MFSFDKYEILERNVSMWDMQDKYPDKYMIVINSHTEEGRGSVGDIIAILTPDEYFSLNKPEPFLPKYGLWKGTEIRFGEFGVYGSNL